MSPKEPRGYLVGAPVPPPKTSLECIIVIESCAICGLSSSKPELLASSSSLITEKEPSTLRPDERGLRTGALDPAAATPLRGVAGVMRSPAAVRFFLLRGKGDDGRRPSGEGRGRWLGSSAG